MSERKITKSDCKYYRESDGNCLNFTYVGEYDPCTDGDLEHCYEKFPHFFNKDERMTEKRLCKFSLTGFQCLVFYKLIQQGKRIILVGDNKFKVVDDND